MAGRAGVVLVPPRHYGNTSSLTPGSITNYGYRFNPAMEFHTQQFIITIMRMMNTQWLYPPRTEALLVDFLDEPASAWASNGSVIAQSNGGGIQLSNTGGFQSGFLPLNPMLVFPQSVWEDVYIVFDFTVIGGEYITFRFANNFGEGATRTTQISTTSGQPAGTPLAGSVSLADVFSHVTVSTDLSIEAIWVQLVDNGSAGITVQIDDLRLIRME